LHGAYWHTSTGPLDSDGEREGLFKVLTHGFAGVDAYDPEVGHDTRPQSSIAVLYSIGRRRGGWPGGVGVQNHRPSNASTVGLPAGYRGTLPPFDDRDVSEANPRQVADAFGLSRTTTYSVALSLVWCPGVFLMFSTIAVSRFARRR
jgi:hypothetical protein